MQGSIDVNGVSRYGGILCTRLTEQKYDMKRDMDHFINANCKCISKWYNNLSLRTLIKTPQKLSTKALVVLSCIYLKIELTKTKQDKACLHYYLGMVSHSAMRLVSRGALGIIKEKFYLTCKAMLSEILTGIWKSSFIFVRETTQVLN